MLDALFGTELSTPVKFAIAFPIILALIVGFIYAVRRLGVGGFGAVVSSRGRQPRLGVTDVAMVGDGRRRLLLIRRDNVEHLVMTGGPTDVVIEANIVRASPAAPARDTAPARAAGDMLPRAIPLPEGGMWPLQPEPISRAQRITPPLDDEEAGWSAPAEPAPRAAPERESMRETARDNLREPPRESAKESALRAQNSDRLSGLAADLSRNFVEPQVPSPPPPRRAEPRRATPPPPTISPTEEQNLAEMAQRLESALQRPRATAESAPPRGAEPAPPVRVVDAAPPVRAIDTAAAEPPPARPEPVVKPVPKKAAPKAAFDSLEQEMASLLGRPGKT